MCVIQVNTNGIISFLGEVFQYTPEPFPIGEDRRLIAPYWSDVDTTNGGIVYYGERTGELFFLITIEYSCKLISTAKEGSVAISKTNSPYLKEGAKNQPGNYFAFKKKKF